MNINLLSGRIGLVTIIMSMILLNLSCTSDTQVAGDKFEPNWRSLKRHQTPQWLSDAKFGIYCHHRSGSAMRSSGSIVTGIPGVIPIHLISGRISTRKNGLNFLTRPGHSLQVLWQFTGGDFHSGTVNILNGMRRPGDQCRMLSESCRNQLQNEV